MITEDTRVLFLLEKHKITQLGKLFQKKQWPKIFVFACFLLVALTLAFGTFFFSKYTFSFLKSYPEFSQSMVFYILSAWFFLIFLLTLGSSIISALGALFIQEDDYLLLSFPIRPQIIFESRWVNLLFSSCWPVIVFGPSLLLGLKLSFNLSCLHFTLSLLALILILLISCLVAAIFSLKITALTGRIGGNLIYLLGLISLPFLAWWTATVLVPRGLVEAFQRLQLKEISQFLKSLPISANFLPSTWVVNFILYWQDEPLLALWNLEKLLILLAVLAILVYWLVNKEYFDDLSKARVGRFIAGPHDIVPSFLTPKSFPYFFKGLKGTFLEKDILIFVRNQTEVLQLGYLLFIILLYFLILGKVPLEKVEERLPNLSIDDLIKMNFLFGAYILEIFSLRFIFPSLSLEGQSAWFIWSAPFPKAQLYWQKLLTGWGFLSLIGGGFAIISGLILKLNIQAILSQFFLFLSLALALNSLNLGLGTLLPQFEENNSEKISTSPGGILVTGLSLFYIFLVGFLLFSTPLSLWLTSLILMIFFSLLSLSKIEKYQF